MGNLHGIAIARCQQLGIDPATVKTPADDPVAWRANQARSVLATLVPERFTDATPDHPAAKSWATRYLADAKGVGNLLMVGPTGTGKTHQAYGIIRHIVTTLAETGASIIWHATDHPSLNADLRPNPNGRHEHIQHQLEIADLIVVDDIGAGVHTDWTADTLYRIINTRWANRRPVIATSNLTKAQLADFIGHRIMSRLDSGTSIALTGNDRRATNGDQP